MSCCKDYSELTMSDGSTVVSHSWDCPVEAKKRSEAIQKRIKEKGHDCFDHSVHEHYERENGGIGDAYYCAICGDLLQVG